MNPRNSIGDAMVDAILRVFGGGSYTTNRDLEIRTARYLRRRFRRHLWMKYLPWVAARGIPEPAPILLWAAAEGKNLEEFTTSLAMDFAGAWLKTARPTPHPGRVVARLPAGYVLRKVDIAVAALDGYLLGAATEGRPDLVVRTADDAPAAVVSPVYGASPDALPVVVDVAMLQAVQALKGSHLIAALRRRTLTDAEFVAALPGAKHWNLDSQLAFWRGCLVRWVVSLPEELIYTSFQLDGPFIHVRALVSTFYFGFPVGFASQVGLPRKVEATVYARDPPARIPAFDDLIARWQAARAKATP